MSNDHSMSEANLADSIFPPSPGPSHHQHRSPPPQDGDQPEAGPSRLSRSSTSSPPPPPHLSPHPATLPSPEPDEDPQFAPPTSYTGFVYDIRMLSHVQSPQYTDQAGSRHPEEPGRISGIFAKLQAAGCVKRMKKVPIREITKAEIELVHVQGHWEKVHIIETADASDIAMTLSYYEGLSLYINPNSPLCARLSAGGVVETALAVMDDSKNIKNAFAIVRPPGHHAEPNEHMGFCFFNNVSVAARVVQQRYGGGIKQVIVDWDVHHGNGTQRAFYSDPSILYVSIHRYDNAQFYPSSTYGSIHSCGDADGIGRTVNIGWESGGKNDADYLYAFQKIVMPILYEFAPDLVFVSAGFDAAEGDPLGGCNVTPAGYSHMLHMLMALAKGKVVVALEGGYNVDAISNAALACTRVLLGETPDMLGPMIASDSATQTVSDVSKVQSRHWKSIDPRACQPRDSFREEQDLTTDVSQLLLAYRNQHLYSRYRLCSFPLVTPELERAFPEHVLCSDNVLVANTVVLFVHDLASVKFSDVKPDNVKLSSDYNYIIDTTDLILKWTTSSDPITGLGRGQPVALIDINLPSSFPETLEPHHNVSIKSTKDVVKSYTALLEYIWDNLLDLKAADTNIILVGSGTGCEALMTLLPKRAVEEKVKAFVQVHGMDAPVKLMAGDKREWFNRVSFRITPIDHPVHGESQKKKYGPLHMSTQKEPLLVLKHSLPMIQDFVSNALYASDANNLTGQLASASL
ncbi:hypothetical protein BDY24DRAFT_388094 [Mrakia frigida]|uniref:histone deacetylase HDA1 n=1 Tax=Mrakia frigida TaxID=29902 RepID=UPI003FCC02F6